MIDPHDLAAETARLTIERLTKERDEAKRALAKEHDRCFDMADMGIADKATRDVVCSAIAGWPGCEDAIRRDPHSHASQDSVLAKAEQRGRDAGVRAERARCLRIVDSPARPTIPKRPTIQELEAILSQESPPAVDITPEGEVRVGPSAERVAIRRSIDIGYGCGNIGCDCPPPHEHVTGIGQTEPTP